MVNAKLAHVETSDWILVLIPSGAYYGLVVLFWMCMVELPWRKQCTWRSFGAMFSSFAQHASLWLGLFWMARYWDRDIDNDNVNWYVLSIPFYGAIVFRCLCTAAAMASLHDLQACMVSREQVFPREAQPPQQGEPLGVEEVQRGVLVDGDRETTENNSKSSNDNLPLPDGYIVVTKDSRLLAEHLFSNPLSLQETHRFFSDADKMNEAVVKTSPEFQQVDHAVSSLRHGIINLAIFGSSFITLIALKLEGHLDISFWIVFAPIWIHLGMRLFHSWRAARALRRSSTRVNNNSTGNSQSPPQLANPMITPPEAKKRTGTAEHSGEPPVGLEDSSQGAEDGKHKIASVSLLTGAVKPGDASDNTVKDTFLGTVTQSMSYDGDRIEIDTEGVPRGVSAAGYSPFMTGDTPVSVLEKEAHDTLESLSADDPPPFRVDLEAGNPPRDTTIPDSDAGEVKKKNDSVATLEIAPDGVDSQSSGNEDQPYEEFERWQSVYEHTEVRSLQSPFISCEVFFQLLVLCLIVAKLEQDYGDTDEENPGFNAFFVILIPLSLGLVVCCVAIVFGCAQIAREEFRNSPSNTIDGAQSGVPGAVGIENDAANELVPMQAGGTSNQPMTFSAHIDVPRRDLTISDRVHLFTAVLAVSTADAETWLVENTDIDAIAKMTLWGQTIAFSDDLECYSVNYDDNITDDTPAREFLALMRKNLQAHFDKTHFQNELAAIEPLDDDDYEDGHDVLGESGVTDGAEHLDGVECLVCCELYRVEDTVHCEGDPIHFCCRVCFHRYATETIDAGDVTGMPCADANCPAMFATPTVRENVSSWDALRMEDRETERNTKVALAAKAVLKCTCGSVGVVTDTDIGDGCITCPGSDCSLQFCALCGNKWHPDTSCPPSKKMLQWVVSNTMPCPNCHTPIEKNAGCDHMHCAPPGGCGHHFSYRTGKPMSRSGTNLRGLYTA